MFESRSKDGRVLYIISYSYQQHRYNVNKYYNEVLSISFDSHVLDNLIEVVEEALNKYNADNPTTQRYHKLSSGDIWDNETETIINHTALIGLLTGLENDDKKTVSEAIAELNNIGVAKVKS